MGGKEFVFSLPVGALVDGDDLLQADRKKPEIIREATEKSLNQLMKGNYLESTTLKKKAFSLKPISCLGFP